MKKISFVLLAFFLIAAISSCKKKEKAEPDDNGKCQTCVTAPEAQAANDNSSAGVYKGVITGSSGTLVFYIQNGNQDIKALIAFDGKSATLTSTYFASWQAGTAISNAQFTGVLDGNTVTATLSVNSDGTNPSLTLDIPGHTIAVAIFKETSASLVKSFEGTYSGDESGALNILMIDDEYTVITNGSVLTRRTKLVDGKIKFTSSGTNVSGEFVNENYLKGAWNNTSNQKGSWEAKRTL